MSRFAAEFFAESPALAYPIVALILFFLVFIVVIIRVIRMGKDRAEKRARIPLEDEPVEARHE
jgi:hypothetical protein